MKERGASTAEHDTDHMGQRGDDRIDTDYNRRWIAEPAKGLVGFGKHKELRQWTREYLCAKSGNAIAESESYVTLLVADFVKAL